MALPAAIFHGKPLLAAGDLTPISRPLGLGENAHLGTTSPSGYKLTARVLGPATVTLHEPILVRLTMTNTTNQALPPLPGQRLHVVVFDKAGTLLSARPPMRTVAGSLLLAPTAANSSRAANYNLVRRYPFRVPGDYLVKLRLYYGVVHEDTPPALEAVLPIRVKPEDPQALAHRCQVLLDHTASRRSAKRDYIPGLDAATAKVALFSVRHDAAIAALVHLIDKEEDSRAVAALRRIGTPAAKRILTEVARRNDNMGETARREIRRFGADNAGDA